MLPDEIQNGVQIALQKILQALIFVFVSQVETQITSWRVEYYPLGKKLPYCLG